jgi:hypothetical protein
MAGSRTAVVAFSQAWRAAVAVKLPLVVVMDDDAVIVGKVPALVAVIAGVPIVVVVVPVVAGIVIIIAVSVIIASVAIIAILAIVTPIMIIA